MTKREKLQIIWAYKLFIRHRRRSLETAYKKPSLQKQRIWAQIQSRARMKKGYNYDLTIITKNTFMFTCGYTLLDDQNISVNFVYITPSIEYVIFASDIIEWAKQYDTEI